MGEGLKVINVKSTKISSLQWPVRCVSTKYGPCEIMDGFCATFIVCALIIWLGEKKCLHFRSSILLTVNM